MEASWNHCRERRKKYIYIFLTNWVTAFKPILFPAMLTMSCEVFSSPILLIRELRFRIITNLPKVTLWEFNSKPGYPQNLNSFPLPHVDS